MPRLPIVGSDDGTWGTYLNDFLEVSLDNTNVDLGERGKLKSTAVDAAGAVMNADTSTAAMNFVVDEDNMASNSATKIPTQQSVKAYVDSGTSTITGKSISLSSNTLTGTTAEFNTALTDNDFATLAGTEVLSNKTLTSAVLNTGISGTAITDEDDMTSNSATKIPTQQSVKAYVDVVKSDVSDILTYDLNGLHQLTLPEVSVASGTVFPIEYFSDDNEAWGNDYVSGKLYKSTDDGDNWTLINTIPSMSQVIRLFKTFDGEMLAVSYAKIMRSSGWTANPTTATWSQVLTPYGAAYFLAWGVDGDGTKFITAQYAAPPNWGDSREVHISLDGGVTWTKKYDSSTAFPLDYGDSHLHGVCYDPWEDRFWFTEGHAVPKGLFFSDDDGNTWTAIGGLQPVAMPTVLVATDDGIVCGSDDDPNGLYGIRRVQDTSQLQLVRTYIWHSGTLGLVGFAQRGYRDPSNGVVYMGFNSNFAAVKPIIAAGTASTASEIWRDPTGTFGDRIWTVLVTNSRKVIGHYFKASSNQVLSGRLSGRGSLTMLDAGNLFQATAGGETSIAAGYGATTAGGSSVALGHSASTTVISGVAIGNNSVAADSAVAIGQAATATATDTLAIGRLSAAGGSRSIAIGRLANTSTAINSIAMGYNANGGWGESISIGSGSSVSGTSSTAIGMSATANASSTSIGANSTAAGIVATAVGKSSSAGSTYSTALGWSANASGADATALGGVTVASANGAVALGKGSTSSHSLSVALGGNTTTTAANQVKVGAKHFEITEMSAPTAPAADNARLYAVDNGGTTELAVRYSTGVAQTLTTDSNTQALTNKTVTLALGANGSINLTNVFGSPVFTLSNNASDANAVIAFFPVSIATLIGYPAASIVFGAGGASSVDAALTRTAASELTFFGSSSSTKSTVAVGEPTSAAHATTKSYVDTRNHQLVAKQANQYYSMTGLTTASTALSLTASGVLTSHPVFLQAGTYDRISVITTVAAVSTWRFGVYPTNSTTGLPDGQTLLLDCGTINMNSSAGLLTATISLTIPTTGVYWLACLVDSYTATPTVHGWTETSATAQTPLLGAPVNSTSGTAGQHAIARTLTGVATGSMPATYPTSAWAFNTPRISVRAS